MTLISEDPRDWRFRQNEPAPLRDQKLEALRRSAAAHGGPRELYLSINDGLPDADPAKPLFAVKLRDDLHIGSVGGFASDVATADASFRFKKDGADNGVLTFPAATADAVDGIIDHFYPTGSLFEVYPPLVADTTLDNVSLSIQIALG